MSAEAKGTEGPEASPKKISKKSKKPLDKPENMCYNKGTKGKEKENKKMFIVTATNLYESFNDFETAHARYHELCHSGKYSAVGLKRVSCD